jgi:hypothetical protein
MGSKSHHPPLLLLDGYINATAKDASTMPVLHENFRAVFTVMAIFYANPGMYRLVRREVPVIGSIDFPTITVLHALCLQGTSSDFHIYSRS